MEKPRENERNPEERESIEPAPAPGTEAKESGYYYDDTTGYEVYDPEKDDDDED